MNVLGMGLSRFAGKPVENSDSSWSQRCWVRIWDSAQRAVRNLQSHQEMLARLQVAWCARIHYNEKRR